MPATHYKCKTTQLIITQQLGEQPVWIQQLNQCEVLIEVNKGVTTDQAVQELRCIESWVSHPCEILCQMCDDDKLQKF